MPQSWSSIRKKLEQDLLCEKLRGRVQYFLTQYHGAPDQYGRFAVRVDGAEVFHANPYNELAQHDIELDIKAEKDIPCREWNGKEFLHDEENSSAENTAELLAIHQGIATTWDVSRAIEEYMYLPIEEALQSENDLVKMFAVMDRRVGKRTLMKMTETYKTQPDWLKKFYELRFEAEKILPEK